MVRLPAQARPLFPYLKPAYTTMTRLVAPVTVQLSRWRGGYLPRTAVDTMEQAAARGGRISTVRPAEVVRRTPPADSPTPHPTFAANLAEAIPRVAIAELPNGRVLGPEGAVITGDGAIVQELSFYFGTTRPREHPLFWHPFPGPPRHVPGRLGVLASRGDRNYYHFLIDVMPRLAIAEQGGEIAPPDRWYVPAKPGFQRELLGLAGLTEDQWIDSTANPHVQADVLVVPGLPSNIVRNPPWVVGFLRRRLMPQPIARVPGRGVYITRGDAPNNRRVVNEASVVAALRDLGFSTADPATMTVREQIECFASASVIVAPHGAALANLVFTSPGAAVVELFPAGYAKPDYWKLANGVPGLAYHYLLGTGPVTARQLAGFVVADIEVDVAVLVDVVGGILDQQRDG